MNNLKTAFYISSIAICSITFAQRPFMLTSNAIHYNPAHVGSNENPTLRWNTSLLRHYSSNRASAEFFIGKFNTGYAVKYRDHYLAMDKERPFDFNNSPFVKVQNLDFVIAPKYTVKKKYTLSPAISIGVEGLKTNGINYLKTQGGVDDSTSKYQLQDYEYRKLSYAFGFKYNTSKFTFGFCYSSQGRDFVFGMGHLRLESGYIFNITDKIKYSPYLLVFLGDEGQPGGFILQNKIQLNNLSIGLLHSSTEHSIELAYQVAKKLKISTMHTLIHTSVLSKYYSMNDFEIGLRYRFIKKEANGRVVKSKRRA